MTTSVPPAPEESFREADHRLRDLLLGDGTYSVGLVKGEEQRRRVATELRHMKHAFEELVRERSERRTDLEGELRARAAQSVEKAPGRAKRKPTSAA